jgi:hypothetical protein
MVMERKTVISFLFCTLLFSFPAFVQTGIAADVETNGNLTVHGVIESTTGGFKFPDGSTLTTGGVAGTPVAHGVVGSAGRWSDLSHSSNVTFVSHALGTGVYEITVSGESMTFLSHTTVISMADTGPGFSSHIYNLGHLVVTTYNTGGNISDRAFTFIIMQK